MLSFKYFFFFFSLVCADLIRGAKEKSLKVKGPVRMPTKVNTRLDFFFYFIFFLVFSYLNKWKFQRTSIKYSYQS